MIDNIEMKLFVFVAFLLLSCALALYYATKKSNARIANYTRNFAGEVRHIVSDHYKDAPKIALVTIHDKRYLSNDLASLCTWHNLTLSPHMSHRIFPISIILNCDDSKRNLPSYSYCKHGRHTCSLYKSLEKYFVQSNRMDILLPHICIHCPKLLPKTNVCDRDGISQYPATLEAIKYVLEHLENIGSKVSYIMTIPSYSMLCYGWDSNLYEQYSLLPKEMTCQKVLVGMCEYAESALSYRKKKRMSVLNITRAQANRNGFDNSASVEEQRQLSKNTETEDKKGRDRVLKDNERRVLRQLKDTVDGEVIFLNILSQSRLKMTFEELVSLLWFDDREAFWTGLDFYNKQNEDTSDDHDKTLVSYIHDRFKSTNESQDLRPTLTPWWPENHFSFCKTEDWSEMLKSVDDINLENVTDSFVWSLMCFGKNVRIFAPLQSFVINTKSVQTKTANKLNLTIFSTHIDFDEITITLRQQSEMTAATLKMSHQESKKVIESCLGITISDQYDEIRIMSVTNDCKLGLIKLNGCEFARDFKGAEYYEKKLKEHDILSRFGSWNEYISRRA